MGRVIIYSFILFLIDLVSKVIISTNLELNNSLVIIDDFFSLTYIKNYGAAFSILVNYRLLLIIVSIIVIILLIISIIFILGALIYFFEAQGKGGFLDTYRTDMSELERACTIILSIYAAIILIIASVAIFL